MRLLSSTRVQWCQGLTSCISSWNTLCHTSTPWPGAAGMVSWGHQFLLGSDRPLAERVVPSPCREHGSHLLPFLALHWACGPGLCPKDKGQLSQAPQGLSKDVECLVSFPKSPPRGSRGPAPGGWISVWLCCCLPSAFLGGPPPAPTSMHGADKGPCGERPQAVSRASWVWGLISCGTMDRSLRRWQEERTPLLGEGAREGPVSHGCWKLDQNNFPVWTPRLSQRP